MEEYSTKEAHVLCLPFRAQGHLNPMIQLSKRLASKGLKVTLIFISDYPSHPYTTQHNITVLTISNGVQEGHSSLDLDDYVIRVQYSVTRCLPELINELGRHGFAPKALVYDSVMPWALDIARSLGLYAVVFITQLWCVNVVYYHVSNGAFSVPSSRDGHTILASFPSLPLLSSRDLPCFVHEWNSNYPNIQKIMIDQLKNIEQVDMVLCNTFDKLEEKVLRWMESMWSFKNIGPTVPSMYLDKRLYEDEDYGLNLFKPNLDQCLTWLDLKQPDLVVYVSFGSLMVLEDKQLKELALGLRDSGHFFLWVVRETEKEKLPRNYSEELYEKGLIVNWCPQLQVLAHRSVCSLITHCGWNSTIDALSLGVPMVGMPQWTDQPTNVKFVEDVWKVGVRVRAKKMGL